ncbi:hypothetical protein CHCC20335_4079 [Bacillus paralicheniformis]|nr:hypothetical protein CHCC20335_4079 [Bacillus paralicheniformis]
MIPSFDNLNIRSNRLMKGQAGHLPADRPNETFTHYHV